MQENKLTVVIVNWNTKDLLEKCLISLYKNTSEEILKEVIVVDNGSSDGSVALLKEKFTEVKIMLNNENMGFATANNKALRVANGKYILFLNTDVIVTKDAIGELLGFMDNHPNAGLCTPSLIREDGSLQETYISFPTLITELCGRAIHRGKKEPCIVQSVRGACMLVRKDLITGLGGFNEKYFLFLEETDLCMRLNKNGYEVWYVPTIRVYHTGGETALKEEAGARIEYWRSRYIFFRENYPLRNYFLLNIGLRVKLVLDWIVNLVVVIFTLSLNKKIKRKFKIYTNIILWHILGKPGDWGISSGNVVRLDNLFVKKEFQSWWEKNKDQIINNKGPLKLLKENKSRKILLYNNEAYIKIYKEKPFFKKPWVKEWRLINRVRQLDIPTLVPIACGNGYLITKKLDNVKTLHDFILDNVKNINFKEKLFFTKSLAEFINKIHKKSVKHGDLHAGNILIERSDNGYKFYITDLHRAGIKICLSKRDIINNLVQLDKFFSIEVSLSTRLRFLKYYVSGTGKYIESEKQKVPLTLTLSPVGRGKGEGAYFACSPLGENYKSYVKEISAKTESSCHDLWQKRDGLYLKKDRYGIKGMYSGIRYILNPDYKNIGIDNIIKFVKPGYGDVIKDSGSSYLSRFEILGIGSVVLKIYKQKKFINYLKDFFRKSRGFKAWCGSWALITRVIKTPEPILAGEIRRYGILKSSFIITRDIQDSKNLTLFVRDIKDEFKAVLLNRLSSYIKKLHNRGIFPKDMKGSNIIVQEKEKDINFYFIDLDHIKTKRKVSLNDRLYNIRQIKNSTGLSCHNALPIKRILIVKPSSLGDIVQAFPVATVIRSNFPSANVWWLANRNYIDLLRVVPSINNIIIFERDRWRKLGNIGKTILEFSKFVIEIRRNHFDMVLDLQGLFRSGFITGLSGAPLRIGFSPVRGRASNGARECAGVFYNKRIYTGPSKMNAQERYLSMAGYVSEPRQFGIGRLNIPDEIRSWAEGIWGSDSGIRIVLNPGGRWVTKRWHINKYAGLIDELNKRYNARIIIIGDKDDSKIADSIIKRINSSIINLSGKTKLTELSAVLSGCNILITNDSGPMHLADYLGRSIVAIFGPTDPFRTGPIGENNKILKSDIPCSPCFKKKCKNIICMDKISIKDVLDGVEDLLKKQGIMI